MHGPTMPLVPIMPTSGENRCMLPPRPWLTLLSPPHEDLAVYHSTLLAAPQ